MLVQALRDGRIALTGRENPYHGTQAVDGSVESVSDRQIGVSAADRTGAGWRVCAAIGPLRLRSPESIDRTFQRIGAAGPDNRLGLHPSTDAEWQFRPAAPGAWTVARLADHFDPADLDTELTAMQNGPVAAPVDVRLRGDYAFLGMDHGLGDTHFMNELSAALSGVEDDVVDGWPAVTIPTHPARVALRHVLRTRPLHVARGVSGIVRERMRWVTDARSPTVACDARPTFVSALSGEGYRQSLRQLTPGGHSASVFSSILYATVNALRCGGIQAAPTAGVMVDLRRYLPDRDFTLSNFVSMIRVATDADTVPSMIDRHLKAELASCRALIGPAVKELRGTPTDLGPWHVDGATAAELVFSENGAPDAVSKFAWLTGAGPPMLTAALPLQHHNQISMLISRLPGGRTQIGASFFADVFDAAAVKAALDDVLGRRITPQR